MKKGEFREAFVDSMREMHDEGQQWLFILDIGRRVTAHDEGYIRRYRRINRILSIIGIERPDEPTKIASPGKLYPTAHRLEHEGLVESTWQHPDAPQREHGRRQYRLVPEEQQLNPPQAV
jgi:hypothetical protein